MICWQKEGIQGDKVVTSVAVVVLDTCRYDTFSEHFGWLEGRRFTNAWSTSHWTVPAHASIYTGKYPSEIGTTVKSKSLGKESESIIEVVEEAGYRPTLITSNLQISAWDGWLRGYNRTYGPIGEGVKPVPDGVVDWGDFNSQTETDGLKKYAAAFLEALRPRYNTLQSLWQGYKRISDISFSADKTLERIRAENFGENEFLMANIMDMHGPYYPPSKYRSFNRRVKPEIEDGLSDTANGEAARTAYKECAEYLSDRYKEIYEELEKDFDYIITLSDHGELLGEHDLFAHTYGLHPELAHVPLVISGAEIENEEYDVPVSLLDIHATISDITDVSVNSRGQSLLSSIESRDRLVEYHGMSKKRRGKFKVAGLLEYFDRFDVHLDGVISEEGYAYETPDGLVVDGNWSADEAEQRLEKLVKSIDRKEAVEDYEEASEDVQKRLEDLGYA